MKFLAVIFLLIILPLKVLATAQYADIIIFKGKEYALFSNPLQEYFKNNPDKSLKTEVMSTALWRGYVATFEVKENQLYVKDIKIQVWKKGSKSHDTEWKSVLKSVFPDKEKRKLDWFTGILLLPYGELVEYEHLGYNSTYENYHLLELQSGVILKAKEFTLQEFENFKERQFKVFKNTDGYSKLFEEIRNKWKDKNDDYIEKFVQKHIISYTKSLLSD